MENKENVTDLEKSNKDIQESKRPNENGQILVDGAVRIFDPSTKEIFVEVRT